jgi:CP family cyanate transporter-like MFS transporter
VAWLSVAIFALQATLFFGLNTWLPAAYIERGWSETSAGFLGSALIAASLVGSLTVALLRDSPGATDRYLVIASVVAVPGCIGFVVFPDGAWAWTALAGYATGVLFVLSLKLPIELGSEPHEVAGLGAVMLALGYWTGGFAPSLLGLIRDSTGTFTASFAVLSALMVVLLVLSLAFARARRDRIGSH